MNATFVGKCVAVFISVAVADVAWAKYMKGVADNAKLKAGLWSAVIVGLSAVSVLAYTFNPIYIVPAMLGAFVGTLVGML